MAPEANMPESIRPDSQKMEGSSPFVFVVGCPRSGTTLLQRMLDSHPSLAVANDTHFAARCLEKFSPQSLAAARSGTDIPLTPELLDGVRDYHRFKRLGLDRRQTDEVAAESSTYREFVSGLYVRFAGLHGKPLGGEKTPDYVRRLDLLAGLFPAAKMIHIIRDGRDVALSVLEWANEKKGPGKLELWKTEPVAVCALWWRWQVETGRRHGAQLGPQRYTDVRYEDLVARPEPELRRLSDFLELPYSEQMVAFNRGKERSEPGLSAKSAWMSPTPGLRDWRTQMSPRDAELFEALAGDLLDDLGLERAVNEISSATAGVANACVAWWDKMLAHRRAKMRRRSARG